MKPAIRPARARLAAAIVAAGIFALDAASAEEALVRAQGRVTDPDGAGVAGQSVRLFKTRRSLSLGKFSSGGQVAEAARVESDASGFYEISAPRDRSYDDYFLRFYDPNNFDQVQYELPADREITKDLRREPTVRVDVRLARRADWTEVKRRIDAFGAESPKGKVLRALGLPEREGNASGPDGPREEWWYHSKGVVYFFRDGRAAGMRHFEPVAAASAGGEP